MTTAHHGWSDESPVRPSCPVCREADLDESGHCLSCSAECARCTDCSVLHERHDMTPVDTDLLCPGCADQLVCDECGEPWGSDGELIRARGKAPVVLCGDCRRHPVRIVRHKPSRAVAS